MDPGAASPRVQGAAVRVVGSAQAPASGSSRATSVVAVSATPTPRGAGAGSAQQTSQDAARLSRAAERLARHAGAGAGEGGARTRAREEADQPRGDQGSAADAPAEAAPTAGTPSEAELLAQLRSSGVKVSTRPAVPAPRRAAAPAAGRDVEMATYSSGEVDVAVVAYPASEAGGESTCDAQGADPDAVAECRICLEEAKLRDLRKPCACEGWVKPECLKVTSWPLARHATPTHSHPPARSRRASQPATRGCLSLRLCR